MRVGPCRGVGTRLDRGGSEGEGPAVVTLQLGLRFGRGLGRLSFASQDGPGGIPCATDTVGILIRLPFDGVRFTTVIRMAKIHVLLAVPRGASVRGKVAPCLFVPGYELAVSKPHGGAIGIALTCTGDFGILRLISLEGEVVPTATDIAPYLFKKIRSNLHIALSPLSGVLLGGMNVAPTVVPTVVASTTGCTLVTVGSPLVCPPGNGFPFQGVLGIQARSLSTLNGPLVCPPGNGFPFQGVMGIQASTLVTMRGPLVFPPGNGFPFLGVVGIQAGTLSTMLIPLFVHPGRGAHAPY